MIFQSDLAIQMLLLKSCARSASSSNFLKSHQIRTHWLGIPNSTNKKRNPCVSISSFHLKSGGTTCICIISKTMHQRKNVKYIHLALASGQIEPEVKLEIPEGLRGVESRDNFLRAYWYLWLPSLMRLFWRPRKKKKIFEV